MISLHENSFLYQPLINMDKIVIIPTYNEKGNIEELINKIIELDNNLDILVVDGNSQDGTGKILEKLQAKFSNIKVIYEKKREGLAKAYIKGFKYALGNNYELILQMDADFQHHPEYISKLLEYAKSHDVVVACRDLNVKRLFEPISIRVKLSILANLYISLVTGMKFSDNLGGYKCYRKEVLKNINWSSIISTGFIFQTEILYRIWKKNYKIGQFPIIPYPRKAGNSKISISTFAEGLFKVLQFRLIS